MLHGGENLIGGWLDSGETWVGQQWPVPSFPPAEYLYALCVVLVLLHHCFRKFVPILEVARASKVGEYICDDHGGS